MATTKKKATKRKPAKKKPAKRKAPAKKEIVKKAEEEVDHGDPHPLAEITLEERDWLMSKFMVERLGGTQAKVTNAKQALEIWQRDMIAKKAALRAQINRAEAEMHHADNEMKVFLADLEQRLGVNLQNYTWQTDGRLIYMGDPDEIDNQEPSQVASQPKAKTEPPPDDSEDEAEAAFLNSRVV